MRQLQGHKVNEVNKALTITAFGEPGVHGAHRQYHIDGFRVWSQTVPSSCLLTFQDGPPAEVGVNGITHEALLEVLIDRLSGFQSGLFACTWNAGALSHLREAKRMLNARTQVRADRGVEGTHDV